MIGSIKNNDWLSRDMIVSMFAAAFVTKIGSKYVQQITNLTGLASFSNAASVVVIARSINTLRQETEGKNGDYSAAKKALGAAFLIVGVGTLLEGTTVTKTVFDSLPALSESAISLVCATAATTFLTAGVILAIPFVANLKFLVGLKSGSGSENGSSGFFQGSDMPAAQPNQVPTDGGITR